MARKVTGLVAEATRTDNLAPAQAPPNVSLAEALLPQITNVPLALKVCDFVRRWRSLS
jgi:hypothetical protein